MGGVGWVGGLHQLPISSLLGLDQKLCEVEEHFHQTTITFHRLIFEKNTGEEYNFVVIILHSTIETMTDIPNYTCFPC